MNSVEDKPKLRNVTSNKVSEPVVLATDKKACLATVGTFIGAVVAFLIVAEIFARVLLGLAAPPSTGSHEFEAKMACAKGARPGETIVCVGSSLLSRGVSAEQLEARLSDAGMKVNVLNLACGGAAVGDELMLLQMAIEKGVKPVALVCDFTPILIGVGMSIPSYDHAGYFMSSYNWKTHYERPKSIQAFFDITLTKLSVIYAFRDYLRNQLERSLPLITDPLSQMPYGPCRQVRTEVSKAGWAPGYNTMTQEELKESFKERAKQVAFYDKGRSGKIEYLSHLRFAQFCDVQGIPLYLIWTPINPLSKSFFDEQLKMTPEECQRALAWTARPGKVFPLDLHSSDSDRVHFLDFDHLNAAGAVQFTDTLGQLLTNSPHREAIMTTRHEEKP